MRFVVVGFRPAGTTVELHSRRIMFLFCTVAYGVTLFVNVCYSRFANLYCAGLVLFVGKQRSASF